MKSVLVVFGDDLPKKKKSWWRQFDRIIAPKSLQEKIQGRGVGFVDIGSLISYGSIQEANGLVSELSRITVADGRTLPKSVIWQGYELWWMHYDDLMYGFCMPYTEYHKLLAYLKDFDKAYLYQPPCFNLFRYFLRAHNRQCIILKRFRLRNLLPIPFGVFIQLMLTPGFLLWLKIIGPKLIFWTSDKLSLPYDYELRQKFIYEELRRRKVTFVEFIRSIESWSTVLRHAWRRKRPVIYSTAIIDTLHSFARLFGENKRNGFDEDSPEKRFWFSVAAHYLGNLRGTIWSIRAMEFILRWVGIRSAIIDAACNRTFHEVLGCKLNGIKTVGIQHGASTRYYFVSDFLPNFDGEKAVSVDKYGLWSEWWREYYLANSRAYKEDQLLVSGPMRPLDRATLPHDVAQSKEGPLKVLFIASQQAAPEETMPYIFKLLETKDFILQFKFRPYRDDFENWLKEHYPDVLEKAKIFRGHTQEAISQSDVTVGSHSSVVLEGTLQLKPFVLFWTNKWGDYFDIKLIEGGGRFFADNPEDLVDKIRRGINVPKDDLKKMQERFFGDPYQNGSQWAVEQAIELAKNYGKRKS